MKLMLLLWPITSAVFKNESDIDAAVVVTVLGVFKIVQ